MHPAYAIGTAVDLGVAESYSVLADQSVTNTGSSELNGDLGVSPGTSLTGFPPGRVLGDVHQTDAHALQAQVDLTEAYNDAAGQAPDDADIPVDLGGLTLTPGVYKAASSVGITGTLVLDGQGNPNAVFVFQVGSALTTAPNSTVALVNDARSCNVFWQIGSSATLDTETTFAGTIMALASITAASGTDIDGRALALGGSVSLDSTTFIGGSCAVPSESPSPSASPSGSASPSASPSPTVSSSPSLSPSPSGTPSASASPTLSPSPSPSPTGGPVPADGGGGFPSGGSLGPLPTDGGAGGFPAGGSLVPGPALSGLFGPGIPGSGGFPAGDGSALAAGSADALADTGAPAAPAFVLVAASVILAGIGLVGTTVARRRRHLAA
jgi:hypothetical protein